MLHASALWWLRPSVPSGGLCDAEVVDRQHAGTLARPYVLSVVEIRPTGVAVRKGSDARRTKEQQKNSKHCPLLIWDQNTYRERFNRGPSVLCRVYGNRRRPSKMVLWDTCNQGYHLWCLDKPLQRVPIGSWRCPRYLRMPLSHLIIAHWDFLNFEP